MAESNLPSWATKLPDGRIQVDPDVVYPLFMDALGYEEPTQAALEVCRRCFTEALFEIAGKGLHVHIMKRDRWALRNFPQGAPINFRGEYNRLKRDGNIPQ